MPNQQHGATVHTESQHPVVELAHRLVDDVNEWSRALDEPLNEAIAAAESELAEAKGKLATLEGELAEKRKRLVSDNLDRRSLSGVRKAITETKALVDDLQFGILEARREVGNPRGLPARKVVGHFRTLCVHVRDGRALLASNAEYDRITPRHVFTTVQANISAAMSEMDTLRGLIEAHGDLPVPLAKTLSELTRVFGLITREVSIYTTSAGLAA